MIYALITRFCAVVKSCMKYALYGIMVLTIFKRSKKKINIEQQYQQIEEQKLKLITQCSHGYKV